ncbi:MAG: VTT domain-containing protein [Acidobacteriota bacterium]
MIESFEYLSQFPTGDVAGLPAISLFLVFFFATFVSEDAACIGAGALAARGEISFEFAVAACFSGIVAGDVLLYWIGRIFGGRLLTFRFANRFVTANSVARGSAWLEKRGASAVFISRFITGLRLPTYLAAGFLKTDFRKFMAYFILAAAIWTPLLIGSVSFSGGLFSGNLIVAAIATFITVRIATKLTSRRNRRIMFGKLKRITRWEFWPLAVFYFPVVCYVLLLAIRHRSLTIFTCANPAIPAGGFVGESKDEIYSILAAPEENREFLLRHRVIHGDLLPPEKLVAAEKFMTSNALSYPVILKPDAGERGKGVAIIGSRAELDNFLSNVDCDHIIQEHIEGGEVSVFYFRYPRAITGQIFSMTEKVFPAVVGDGVSTLEELILSDDRAICIADQYFEENRPQLSRVPAKGEAVRIVRIGTHSRGAIFLDGTHLKTPQLEDAIDGICRRVEGFNFGRFDIRYSSLEEFRSGTRFKIIELNGVTSESTNIYDPRYSLLGAYRILFRQWRIAFEIGAENRRLGTRSTRLFILLRDSFYSTFARAA